MTENVEIHLHSRKKMLTEDMDLSVPSNIEFFLALIYRKNLLLSLKRLSCSQNQFLTLPWTILLIFDIPHMQNHLLKATREVEKLELHGLRIGIYTDFTGLLLKKGKCFLHLRNHSNRWAYLLYFYF